MQNLAIVISNPLDPNQYETILTQIIEKLSENVSINFELSKIKQIDNENQQITRYLEIKSNLTKYLDIIILPSIKNVNELESILLNFYNLTRKIISKNDLKKIEIKIPIFTQVLFNLKSYNNYDEIYVDNDEENLNSIGKIIKFKTTESKEIQTIKNLYNDNEKFNEYEIGCIGGTFDHLHDGHKILLSLGVFLSLKKLVIGLSNDPLLVKKTNFNFLQNYQYRYNVLLQFIKKLKPNLEVEIYPLNDIYGPTATINDMDVLLVTEETVKGGRAVNDKRKENGLKPLDVFVVKLIEDDNDKNDKISSTFTREKELKEFRNFIEN